MAKGRTEQEQDQEHPPFGPGSPAREAVRAAVAGAARAAREAEADAYRLDVEGVHRLRSALRRLRSVLRVGRPLLDRPWAEATLDDLKWAGQILGAVRDRDVLESRLRDAAGRRRASALAPLLAWLDRPRAEACAALRSMIDGPRYRGLLARLDRASERPPTTPAAERACRDVLPGLLAPAWRRLKQCARHLGQDAPESSYHEARIRAKRARYAADALAPGLGRRDRRAAERFARQARGVQGDLGRLQDTVLVRRFLATLPREHGREPLAKAIRRRQDRDAREATARFEDRWEKLDRRRNLRWKHAAVA